MNIFLAVVVVTVVEEWLSFCFALFAGDVVVVVVVVSKRHL